MVIIYYRGGPLDGEHQSMASTGTDPGYTMTILIEPISYLDPTGGDYQPPDNTQATYEIVAPVTDPLFSFTRDPTTLPASGLIPAGWAGPGSPPAALQMTPGGKASYIGSPGPPPVPPNQDEWTGNWIFTATEWFWDPFLDITPDASYLFTYVGEQPVEWSG